MGLRPELKNEIGNIYGPWKVVKQAYYNYNYRHDRRGHGGAHWECICMKCGYHYRVYGYSLRRNAYRHKCPKCDYKGED